METISCGCQIAHEGVQGQAGWQTRDTSACGGSHKGEAFQEVSGSRVSNIIVRCTVRGWEIEPDQRHVYLIVRELGLREAKVVNRPGEAHQKWDEELIE